MCAASVYPEPGSNSQFSHASTKLRLLKPLIIFLEFLAHLFVFFMVVQKTTAIGLFFKGLLFTFQCALCYYLFGVTFVIVPRLTLSVNRFLKNILYFLKIFLKAK